MHELSIKDSRNNLVGSITVAEDNLDLSGLLDVHVKELVENNKSEITTIRDEVGELQSTIIKINDSNYYLALKRFLEICGYTVEIDSSVMRNEVLKLLKNEPDNELSAQIEANFDKMSLLQKSIILEELKKL